MSVIISHRGDDHGEAKSKMAKVRRRARRVAALGAFVVMTMVHRIEKNNIQQRKCWLNSWKGRERREAQELAINLVKELRETDLYGFHNFFQ